MGAPQRDYAMVDQVAIVGALQITLGVLELAMGGMFLGLGIFMPMMMSMANAQNPGQTFGQTEWMVWYYYILGCAVLLFSIMRIVSGISSFGFRGRLLMIGSLCGGLISVMTCYCAPFTFALCIYGLIVMFSSGVAQAYRMAASGIPAAEVKQLIRKRAFGAPQT